MLTNIDIDEELIAEAMKVMGARSKREAVDRALRELVARSKRTRFEDIWGKGGIEPGYDPKAAPGEAPGMHRVEQVVATYKTAPARPASAKAKKNK
jgi:hypothetical protein